MKLASLCLIFDDLKLALSISIVSTKGWLSAAFYDYYANQNLIMIASFKKIKALKLVFSLQRDAKFLLIRSRVNAAASIFSSS